MRNAGLPLLGLIRVGIEPQRQLLEVLVHLRAVLHRLDKRADIGDESRLASAEEAGDFRHRRVHGEIRQANGMDVDETAGRQGKIGS